MKLTTLRTKLVLCTLLAALVSACRSGPSDAEEGAQGSGAEEGARASMHGHGESDYVLVLLRGGPAAPGLAPEKRAEVMRGHMDNINRLALEGHLLVAGPFGMPNPDATLRGIFVFRGSDIDHVRELCESDPSVAADVFVPELFPMRATSAVHQVYELDVEAEGARPEGESDFRMRGYVLFLAPQADKAAQVLAEPIETGRVLLFGRLGGDRKGEALVILDAEKPEEVQELLEPLRSGPEARPLFPWHGSSTLVRLPDFAHGS